MLLWLVWFVLRRLLHAVTPQIVVTWNGSQLLLLRHQVKGDWDRPLGGSARCGRSSCGPKRTGSS